MRVIRGRAPVPWEPAGDPRITASEPGIEIGVRSFLHPGTGEKVENPFFTKSEGVTVCSITTKRSLLLVRQFKQAANAIVTECPAGFIRPGEKAVEAAERELQEETGFAAKEVIETSPAQKMLHAPRKSPSGFYTCVALGCRDIGDQSLDATEDAIEVLEATPGEVWEFLRSGEIRSVESREAFFNALLWGYLRFPHRLTYCMP